AQPTGSLARVYWPIGGLTAERLVAQCGVRGVRYCAAAPRTDTSWTPGLATPAIDVGGEGSIVRLVTGLTHLYIATTAGLLDLDSSGLAPNLVPQAETMPMPQGGLASMVADGWIYYSAN